MRAKRRLRRLHPVMLTILEIWNFHQQERLRNIVIEGVCGIRP